MEGHAVCACLTHGVSPADGDATAGSAFQDSYAHLRPRNMTHAAYDAHQENTSDTPAPTTQ